MIFDHISNLARYASLHPSISSVVEILSAGKLSDGSFSTPDGSLKYSVQSYETKDEDKAFEYHRQNADVQVMLKGEEICQFSRVEPDMEAEAFRSADIAFMNADADERLLLSEGMFAIYFPGELHKPGLAVDGKCSKAQKAVFKLLF